MENKCYMCAYGVLACDEKGEYLYCYFSDQHYKNTERKICSSFKSKD